ncbi:MAG: hypothetical protein Q8K69_15780, partial [Bacteroidota bacterium]|nr:hypothetical protein [Bacteroidota bacterium]
MKQMIRWTKMFFVLMIVSNLNSYAVAKTEVKELVCEYQVNPMGIDVQKPRLSWQIISAEDNLLQTAYEIKVTD